MVGHENLGLAIMVRIHTSQTRTEFLILLLQLSREGERLVGLLT